MVQQEQDGIRRQVRIRTSEAKKEKKQRKRGRGIPELEREILEELRKDMAAAVLTPLITFPLPSSASLTLSASNINPFTPISSGFRPFPIRPYPPYSRGGSSGGNWMDFLTYNGAERGREFEPIFVSCLPDYLDPVWASSGVVTKKQKTGTQQKPSSMVNIPESPQFSSGVNLWMGLPSSQNYSSGNLMRMRPDDGRMDVSLKQGHNDPPESSSRSISFQPKVPLSGPSCHRWDELSPRHDMYKFESGNDTHREGSPTSSIVHATANNMSFVKTIKEKGSLDERCLTLSPPAASKSKPKQPTPVPSTHHCEIFVPFKGSMEQSFFKWEVLRQPQPSDIFPMGHSSDPSFPARESPTSKGRGEEADSTIDLNLKL